MLFAKSETELPNFEINFVPFKDDGVWIRFEPKADMTPIEALMLSMFMLAYRRGAEFKPGSMQTWLIDRGLIRHFEVS